MSMIYHRIFLSEPQLPYCELLSVCLMFVSLVPQSVRTSTKMLCDMLHWKSEFGLVVLCEYGLPSRDCLALTQVHF